ncbi:MAG: glycosyltransferase family 2 protein [Limisphaerales bacterium]
MAESKKAPLTVIVPAKNEEMNLRDCLRSVDWVEKVFVVDSHSDDATPKICKDCDVELVQFDYDGGWPKKKNWAIKNLPIKTDWIFILDADERITSDLRAEIEKAIERNDKDGYYTRWKFVFLGRWMKHSWSHGWMLRFFRKGKGEYEDLGMRGEGGWDNEVHENIVVDGPCARLSSPLLHETNQDLAFWIRKQNEFSTWNAKRRLQQLDEPRPSFTALFSGDPLKKRKFLKSLFIRMPFKPVVMFLYLYVLKLGVLDGRSGFYFCVLRAIHEFNIDAKVFEARQARLKKA